MEKCKKIFRKASLFFHRYINGTRGIISILLALLMTPFLTITGALISAARMNSVIAVFDEALCNASNSTLGTYDDFLRERFGLLAISQNTSGGGEGYTAEDFIIDTFRFYMNENMKSLNNTYTDATVTANGIYPLADTDVLLSQTMEYSKYSIPTKMIIDGFDLDSLLSEFTGKLKIATNFMNTISAGIDVGTDLEDCQTKLETLKTNIETAISDKEKYTEAYNEFVKVVKSHNSLIDERNREVGKCERAVETAKENLAVAKQEFQNAKAKYQGIVDVINALRNEKDAEGKPVDNSARIKYYEETYEEELKTYYEAEENQRTAEDWLRQAEKNLEKTIEDYESKISNKRNDVKKKRNNYSSKINTLATAIQNVNTGIENAQVAISKVISSGSSLVKNVVTTANSLQDNSVKQDIEGMKDSKKAAEERGDKVASYLWDDEIAAAKEKQTELANTKSILNAGIDAKTEGIKGAAKFAADNETYKAIYDEIYKNLIALKANVDKITIPTELNKMGSVESYYYSFTEGLTVQDITNMLDELVEDAAFNGFLTMLKALVGFIKAMLKMQILFDIDLTATLDKSLYSNIGGLPSSMDQSKFKSQFADADSQKSSYYKQLLGAYSSSGGNAGSVDTIESTVKSINTQIDVINQDRKWSGWNFFKSLGEVAIAIAKICGYLVKLANKIMEVITTAIYEKLLLAGYLAYNVPNRCKHSSSQLTGESYNLPNKDSKNQGYAFYGAELEYILIGNTSETANQSSIFFIIYGLRTLLNIPFLIADQEVASIASAAGSATFGIGTVIVYILYILAEPLVDTLVLVNSGGIPMFKTCLYLTPSGIVDLIGKLYTLKLTEEQKNTAYKNVIKVMSAGNTEEKFQQSYADAVSSGIADDSIKAEKGLQATARKTLEFDYTKMLLIMCVFWNTDTLMKRTADIIQMEATYKYLDTGTNFNLAKSYTYLRASGSFSTTEFIKISDSDSLRSTERVVYRGY